MFTLAHDWMYRLNCRWFKLSVETFDALHYAGMAVYKIGILLLNSHRSSLFGLSFRAAFHATDNWRHTN
ncbi:DUF6868 family protein [Methyloglobulus morosus]|uniref:DUF6868 family protein n=1 Tax=Methyloglobulus morosus TaxID=1410681 RepID=UPI0038994C91